MEFNDSQTADELRMSQHLWDEYKYRHDLIWQRILTFTTAFALISITPYVEQDVVRLLGNWILMVPLLALLFAFVMLVVMRNELGIFGKVKQAYRRQQNKVLDDPEAHDLVKPSAFKEQVQGYCYTLILLAVVNGLILWQLWIPGVLEQPICS